MKLLAVSVIFISFLVLWAVLSFIGLSDKGLNFGLDFQSLAITFAVVISLFLIFFFTRELFKKAD